MRTSFDTEILGFGNNTGIEVPPERLAEIGAGKRPPVVVTVDGYSYKSTVGVMGGRTLISLPKQHRDGAGLKAGDQVRVTLVLDGGNREVDLPPELRAALEAAGLTGRFAGLAYSRRKEYARQVAEAKAEATRERRIAKVLDAIT